MALDHFINSDISRQNHEIFTKNFYKVTLIPPTGVAYDPIVIDAILSVTGFKIPGPADAVKQQFQNSRRNFADSNIDQTQNINILFQLNLNNANELYVYNIIQDWRRRVFEPLTGASGLKVDYAGTAVIQNARRDGEIFWERTLHNFWPVGDLTEFTDVDYTDSEPGTLSTDWIADYYTENVVQST